MKKLNGFTITLTLTFVSMFAAAFAKPAANIMTPDSINNTITQKTDSFLKYFYSFSPGQIVCAILLMAIAIGLYFYYRNQSKPNTAHDYYRELPGSYSPAVISILMDSWVELRDISATLLDLIRRRHLILEEDKETTTILFFKAKEINNYIISRAQNPPNDYLQQHETFLIDLFLNNLGSDGKVSFLDIKNRIKDDVSLAQEFREKFDEWKNLVKSEAIYNYKLVQDRVYCRIPSSVMILYIVVAVLLVLFSFLNLLPIIIITVLLSSTRKTPFGVEQYHKWKAFSRYLKDFDKLSEASIPLIKWEQYFVYAISLGVGGEVITNLKSSYTPEQFNDANLTFLHLNGFIYNNSFLLFEEYIKEINSIAKSLDDKGPSIENNEESSDI